MMMQPPGDPWGRLKTARCQHVLNKVLTIHGGAPLKGTVKVRGAKNLVPKAMVASLLGDSPSILRNVPDIKDVDVVTLYLLPSVNLALKPVLQQGLKPGARVVSHDFTMGEDWKADKEEHGEAPDDNGGTRSHTLYLWTIKEKK